MKRLLIPMFALTVGCVGSAAVRGDKRLPVRNVVLYRSGVGYFERAGEFDGEAIEFHVKQSEVGDFLASLTAVERGAGGGVRGAGGGVRSVSFEVPESPTPPPANGDDDGDDEGDAAASRPPPEEARVDVKLAFASERSHELSVAYVVGAPVWRPSYRVVFDEGGKALLQAWAVVQNTSGEDWRDIKLSLTTGAPISFRSDLGTPITPVRPLVSDRGEVVDYVPTGETVVEQQAEKAAPPPPAPAPEAAAAAPTAGGSYEVEEEALDARGRDDVVREQMQDLGNQSAARAKRRSGSTGGIAGGATAQRMDARQLAASVQAQVQASTVTESVTRYDLAQPVTIPNGGSTMVAIISTQVAGEQAHLFAPEPGVPLSGHHPFAVARLHNGSGAVLEKGSVAVLSKGAFLGQGLLDTLPRDAQAFVPFALDKSLVVEPAEHWSEEQGALVRVQRGLVTVQRFSQRKTNYQLRNGGATAAKVYVRHARWAQAELVAPPKGTELAPDKALVPIEVAAHDKAALEVVERTPVELDLTIMDPRAAEAIALYLSGPAASDPQSAELKRALALRTELFALEAEIGASEREQHEVTRAADEARQNLKAISKLARAQDLRASIFERLKGYDARAGELTKKLIQARTRQAELQVRLHEALEQVSLQPKA